MAKMWIVFEYMSSNLKCLYENNSVITYMAAAIFIIPLLLLQM